MAAEPQSPKPRGRTATGAIPDQEKGGRLVREWAMDEGSEEEQRETLALLMKAYVDARAPGAGIQDLSDFVNVRPWHEITFEN